MAYVFVKPGKGDYAGSYGRAYTVKGVCEICDRTGTLVCIVSYHRETRKRMETWACASPYGCRK